MKKSLITLAVLLALACAGCTQTPPPAAAKQVDTRSADLADIKALEDGFVKAAKAKDVDAIMSFYVPDESLLVFDVSPPRQYVGAAAYKKDWTELMGLFPGPIDLDMTDLDITVGGGDVAYGRNIQHIVGALKGGRKLDFTVRLTDGYKKVNGKWLIAHEHVSVPVDVLTAKADITSKP